MQLVAFASREYQASVVTTSRRDVRTSPVQNGLCMLHFQQSSQLLRQLSIAQITNNGGCFGSWFPILIPKKEETILLFFALSPHVWQGGPPIVCRVCPLDLVSAYLQILKFVIFLRWWGGAVVVLHGLQWVLNRACFVRVKRQILTKASILVYNATVGWAISTLVVGVQGNRFLGLHGMSLLSYGQKCLLVQSCLLRLLGN